MKKLLILAAALLTLSASAQTKEEEALSKKLAKSDETIADEKKASAAKTWIDRAGLYLDASTIYTNKLIAGFAAEPLLAQVGTPKSVDSMVMGGVMLKKYIFDNVDVYVNAEGLIQYWKAKKEYIADALKLAFDNLKKAKEIDAKGFASKGESMVMRLDNQLQTDAMASYSLGQPAEAAKLFDGSYDAKELIGKVDTVSVFYAGVAYQEAKQYDKALARFEKALSIGYMQDGAIYYYIGVCQDQLDKKDEAIKTYETGFAKYPNNQAVMAGLINAYMVSGKNTDQLIEIVHKAQELDPKNVSLYLVESNVWDKLGNKEKAEDAMLRAEKIAPNDFNVFYNYAILKVLQAEKMVEEAGKLDLNETKKYNDMMASAVELQKIAITKLEKAYEIDPKNEGPIDLLRQLYFPRRADSPEMQTRYDFFNDLFQKRQGAQ